MFQPEIDDAVRGAGRLLFYAVGLVALCACVVLAYCAPPPAPSTAVVSWGAQ